MSNANRRRRMSRTSVWVHLQAHVHNHRLCRVFHLLRTHKFDASYYPCDRSAQVSPQNSHVYDIRILGNAIRGSGCTSRVESSVSVVVFTRLNTFEGIETTGDSIGRKFDVGGPHAGVEHVNFDTRSIVGVVVRSIERVDGIFIRTIKPPVLASVL